MGFWDIFKKKEEVKPAPVYEEPQARTNISMTKQGRKVIECFDKAKRATLGYDTVTVVVDNAPRMVGGKTLYSCQVKWTRYNDTVFFDDINNPESYTQVLVGLEPYMLEADPNYLQSVVWELLKKERVNRYLDRSMMTEEEISQEAARTGDRMMLPCGKYVGFIDRANYGKKFDPAIGRVAHNLPEMVSERTTTREEKARRAKNNDMVHRKLIEYEKAQLVANPSLAQLFPEKYKSLGLINERGEFLFNLDEFER